MGTALDEFNHTEDKIVGGVERIENLVSANSESLLSRRAAFNFDKAKFPRLRVFAFNIIPHLIELAVHRLKSKTALDLHDDPTGARRNGEPINHILRFGYGFPSDLRKQSKRHYDETAQYHRRQRGDLAFQVELLHSLLKTTLKVVRSPPGFLRIYTGVGSSSLFLKFEFLRTVIPVVDLLRQTVFDRCAGLIDPFDTPATDFLQMLGDDLSDGVTLGLLF